jgi:hypothetical protein
MFTTIRKNQRWLMLVVALLTIIAFAFLYNTTEMDRVGTNMVAKIYGRDVMTVDIERSIRNYQLALALGQFPLVRDLSGQAQTEDEAANNFIWNLMVLQHEAAALGVEPGADQVIARIKTLPVFQTGGNFDPRKYADFLQEQLAPRGFTERQLEDVIKDSLRLEGVKALVESPAMILPGDIEPALERAAPAEVEVVRIDAAAAGQNVAVTDEELRSAFDAKASTLQAPEKRSVRYVAFVLTPEEAKLKDKERLAALQKISTATGDFAQAVADAGKSLAEVAGERGLEARTTPFFASDAAADGKLSALDGEVVPAAAPVAFRLPNAPGNVEIVALGDENGYAVIEVAGIQAARPMTFEEARADLRAELIAKKRDEAVRAEADRVSNGLREALAGGKSFAEAARQLKIKTVKMNDLSAMDQELKPDQRQIAMAAMNLEPGQLGEFMPDDNGGFIAYLVSRGEPDAELVAERKPAMEQGMLQGKKMLLFAQWLAAARQQSDLRILRPMM